MLTGTESEMVDHRKSSGRWVRAAAALWAFSWVPSPAADHVPDHANVHEISASSHEALPPPPPEPLPTPLPRHAPIAPAAPGPTAAAMPEIPTVETSAPATDLGQAPAERPGGGEPQFLARDPLPDLGGDAASARSAAEESEPEPEPPLYDASLAVPLFYAIADRDYPRIRELLNARADPDATLPMPPPDDFVARFPSGNLAYYVRREPGFTALMLAAGMGDETSVRFLLMAGAQKFKLSERHKTFPLYLAAREGHLEVMRLLMDITPDSPALRYRVTVSLADQKATVWEDGEPVLVTPISSGKKAKPTPSGRYLVTNKYRQWKSTIYNVSMPYFLRLSCSDFGFHAGRLPGYPASSGCIRLPEDRAKQLFAMLPVGTLVEID